MYTTHRFTTLAGHCSLLSGAEPAAPAAPSVTEAAWGRDSEVSPACVLRGGGAGGRGWGQAGSCQGGAGSQTLATAFSGGLSWGRSTGLDTRGSGARDWQPLGQAGPGLLNSGHSLYGALGQIRKRAPPGTARRPAPRRPQQWCRGGRGGPRPQRQRQHFGQSTRYSTPRGISGWEGQFGQEGRTDRASSLKVGKAAVSGAPLAMRSQQCCFWCPLGVRSVPSPALP